MRGLVALALALIACAEQSAPVESPRAGPPECAWPPHNHTVQKNRGRPALGQPVLSTSDVQLLRGLAADLGMREARVTNGLYTACVPATQLSALETRE
jgi:hypothetical protein